MDEFFETAGGVLAAVFLFVLFVVGGSWLGFKLYEYYNPKYTQVQYNTFKQSQQYNDGMANRLEQYQEAYDQCSTTACRDNIASMVKHDFASYDESRLPPQLQLFYDKMKGN